MYVDTLKDNEGVLDCEINKMKEREEMKDRLLKEIEKKLKYEKEEHEGTKATVKMRESEILITKKDWDEELTKRERKYLRLKTTLKETEKELEVLKEDYQSVIAEDTINLTDRSTMETEMLKKTE